MTPLMIVRCPGCKHAFMQEHVGQRFHSTECCSGYYGRRIRYTSAPDAVPAILKPNEELIKSNVWFGGNMSMSEEQKLKRMAGVRRYREQQKLERSKAKETA